MKTDRLVWLDALRIIAGISMVGLHCSADSFGQPWADYGPHERTAPLLVRAVLYTARTELFLVISAFLLLLSLSNRPRSYGQTITEQARRLGPPFLFWTVFYAAYGLIKAGAFGYFDAALSDLGSPFAWFGYVVLGDVKYHMHFVPTLFGLLLFYPLFVAATRFPIVALGVCLCLTLRWELDAFLYKGFWEADWLPFALRITKITTYVGYGLFAGAAVGIWQRKASMSLQQLRGVFLYFAGLLFLVKLVAIQKTIETGQWQFTYLPGYWADFLMPMALFAICLCSFDAHWPPILSTWAPYSFGIYLGHPIFLDACEIILQNVTSAPILQMGMKFGVTLALTVVLVRVLAKSKKLGWVIGMGPLPFVTISDKNVGRAQ